MIWIPPPSSSRGRRSRDLFRPLCEGDPSLPLGMTNLLGCGNPSISCAAVGADHLVCDDMDPPAVVIPRPQVEGPLSTTLRRRSLASVRDDEFVGLRESFHFMRRG